MSEETANKQEMPEQLSDILLVLDKEKNENPGRKEYRRKRENGNR